MFKKNRLFVVLMFLSLFVVSNITLVRAKEISRDARKHMLRGEAAMEEAKDTMDYQDAVKEFKEAVKYAPDWADAWFNLGVAQESAEDYRSAIESLNKYLKLNPKASDRVSVENRIFKLEYKAEKQQQEESKITEKSYIAGLEKFSGDYCNLIDCQRPKASDLNYEVSIHGQDIEISKRSIDRYNGWENREIYNGTIDAEGKIHGTFTDGTYVTSGTCVNRYMHLQFDFEGELKREGIITPQGRVINGGAFVIRYRKPQGYRFDYNSCTLIPHLEWYDGVLTLVPWP